MSVVPVSRPQASAHTIDENELSQALDAFQQKLSVDEASRFKALQSIPDASSVIAFTAQLDQAAVKRKGRCLASRVCALLNSVQQFSGVVGTFVSSNPSVAALVWGSVQFMLLLANHSFSFFEKLSRFLMSLDGLCPRFSEYQFLFQDSQRLQSSLCSFYAEIIKCCTAICDVLRNPTWMTLLRGSWDPFESQLGPFQSRLRSLAKNIKGEVQLAADKAASIERDENSKFRRNADDHFGLSRLHFSRSENDRLMKLQRRQDVEFEALLRKLSDHDYERPFLQARDKRHAGTAEWFVHEKDFKTWCAATEPSVLWLTGKLGCGKTILMSNAINHILLTSPQTMRRVSYFFSVFSHEASKSALTIIRSLIKQCFRGQKISPELRAAVEQVSRNSLSKAQDLTDLLIAVIKDNMLDWIVLDGVDECSESERQSLLRVLKKAMRSTTRPVKLLITCRNDAPPSFGSNFGSHQFIHSTVNYSAIDADIEIYVSDMTTDATSDEIEAAEKITCGDPNLRLEISKSVVQGADSMFLWVYLQLNEIRLQPTDHKIRLALQSLPKTLEETYARILARIAKNGKKELASNVFDLVAAAKRPFSLAELRDALAVELYAPSSQPDRLVNDAWRIIPWCEGALVLEEIGDEVRFAHPSIEAVLIDHHDEQASESFQIDLEKAEKRLGEICVTYLNFSDFERQMTRYSHAHNLDARNIIEATVPQGQKRLFETFGKISRSGLNSVSSTFRPVEQLSKFGMRGNDAADSHTYPFLAYAKHHWLLHSAKFSHNDRIWLSWKRLATAAGDFAPKPWPSLELFNWTPEVCELISQNNHVAIFELAKSLAPPPSSSAVLRILLAAVAHKSVEIAIMVLDQWPLQSNDDLSALLEGFRHVRCDQILTHVLIQISERQHIEYRLSNLEKSRSRFLTLLQVACRLGALNTATKLISAGADVNAPAVESFGQTALQAAAEQGHLHVVEHLLAANVDVNAPASGRFGRTALQAAAECGHLQVVERLLAAGADVNAPASESGGQTALEAAIEFDYLQVVERLLAAGADVNAPATRHPRQTALQAAAKTGYLHMVERLLAAGADVNAPAGEFGGQTALQAAAVAGDLQVVECLLAAGADVNVWCETDDKGRSVKTSVAKRAAKHEYSTQINKVIVGLRKYGLS